ncbi:amino acid adenylation domain-containing protein [Pokkaliibacter sp. MBI-7]|uniref:non-ribosomal peptide synthetase n=1 Tax=Pokkaliibacter sp. MBI-7 TaxID=3040600 RepID=UPI002447FB62|nr:non-ribosomal peptide synthetase [Pokkaliibacter sp. MBI-7]MDH2433777.1 amino acid adenylation domain-containing protein [Pokkaliibacter sp. MBI-7]
MNAQHAAAAALPDSQLIARRFAALPADKRAQFLQALAKQGLDFARLPIIAQPHDWTQGVLPSYAQQRQWFLWQWQPDSAAYHIHGGVQLQAEGPDGVQAERIAAVFHSLILRHGALRTVFAEDDDGQLRQYQQPDWPRQQWWRYEDLSLLAAEQRTSQRQRLQQQLISTPFDLQHGPLLRVALLRLSATEHQLLLVLHHSIADGWSLQILMEEFTRLYAQPDSPLPPLPIDYADYALWQRNWLEAGEQTRQLAYWRQQLPAPHPLLALPVDHPRRSEAEYQGADYVLSIPAPLRQALQHWQQARQQQGMTLFVPLLAAWHWLLQRYSGQTQIRVGVPVANRQRGETQGLVGFFVNTQVLPLHFSEGMTVAELTEQLRQQVQQAQNYQDIPFDMLVDGLEVERSLSHPPLFQSLFNYLHQPAAAALSLPGVTITPLASHKNAAQFELSLTCQDSRSALQDNHGEMQLTFSYAAELFEEATIVRLAEHYLQLLHTLVDEQQQALPLQQLALATPAAWQQQGCRDPEVQALLTLIELFEAQADRTPDAEALVALSTETPLALSGAALSGAAMSGDGSAHWQRLSYRQLDQRANQLAHALQARGIGSESRVGVALDRQVDLLTAVLAVLKCGAAYIPLDPDYPRERLAYMVEQSGVATVLSQSSLLDQLPLQPEQALLLDQLDLHCYSAQRLALPVHAEQLAYMIYTSGSTGLPKGVMVRQQALSNFLLSMAQQPGFEAGERLLAVTSLSFDIAALELYLPLICGGTVVLASQAQRQDGTALVALLQQEGISVMQATPASWRLLLDQHWRAPRGFRALCGGEALPRDLADSLLQQGIELWNMYGPTETTIWSACARVGLDSIHLGQPLAATDLRVVDAELNLLPAGIAGELLIGGDALARGYFGRAALTAERFLPDPFRGQGQRLYRTGDLVRWCHDGRLEYLGRIDSQVKVRGFRIELGEIEAHLNRHPAVRQGVVLVRDNPRGGYLAACVEAQHTLELAELRHYLSQHLPDYMLPATLTLLSQLPLTPNGKVDRKALAARAEVDPAAAQGYQPPQGDMEQQLATIWQQVLQRDQVGRQDNFFALGGDSILSLQIVSRARQQGWKLVPRQLFEHQTLQALASVVEPLQPTAQPLTMQELLSEEVRTAVAARYPLEDVYPLSPMQQGMLFHSRFDDSGAYVNQLRVAITGEGFDLDRFRFAWQQVVARHGALRSGFIEHEQQPLQWLAAAVELPLRLSEGDADVIAGDELARPFDLQQPPLMRLCLVATAAHRYELIWTVHHLLLDGWSTAQLLAEVLRLYHGEALPLPPARFRDYIGWLQRQDNDASLDQWQQALQPLSEPTYLANCLPRPVAADGYGQHQWQLTPAQTAHWQQYARAQHMTLNTLLQGAWLLLLQRYSGQATVCMGATVAGRPVEVNGIDQVLGLFINTLPVVATPAPAQLLGDWLQELQQQQLRLREHQHIPLAQLQRLAASSGNQALFDTLLVVENYPVDHALRDIVLPSASGALRMQKVASHEQTHYPLTLTVYTGEGLTFDWRYRLDCFTAAQIEQLGQHWQSLLVQMTRPQQARLPLATLQLLTPAQQQAWQQRGRNDQQPLADCAEQGLIHRLFEAQARQQPERIALVSGQQSLSYAELNRRASQLAHALLHAGVGPEQAIGVACARGPEMLISVLAVLKAGATYVPLDPEYPAERLRYMAEHSGMRWLLSQSALLAQVDFLPAGVQALALDQLPLADQPGTDPAVAIHPGQLAYVIYTSGSTGLPKGVMVRHGALGNFLHSMAAQPGLNARDRLLAVTSLSFDIAALELYLPLICGATLVLADAEQRRDGRQLARLIDQQQITLMQATPASWRLLLDSGWQAPTGFRALCGGEALPQELADSLLAQGVQLWNMYGPTETTIWSSLSAVQPGSITLGQPLAATSLYVVDRQWQLVPDGVAGELLIGGEGLARGYFRHPALTAERFVASPFSECGERLYRTGDLVRWADGELEYLGRIDHQVKVRGFRIELGEIESRLERHPAVHQAVVSVRDGAQGAFLAAYIQPHAASVEAVLTLAELRQYLASQLPDYMLPATLTLLPVLPLTPNGKVDRKALPQPEQAQCHYEPPATVTEQQLAQWWGSLLQREQVGRQDHFFDLGGHSLLAVSLISRINEAHQLSLPVRLVYEQPRLAELAAAIDHQQGQGLTAGKLDELEALMDSFMD